MNRFGIAICVLAGLFALALTPAFSAGSSEASAHPVTFTINYHFTPQEARGVVLRDVIARYNASHAGKVKIEESFMADWQPFQQKMRTMIAAGQSPGLFYFNLNKNDLSLFQSGELVDFTPYMDQAWRDRFFPDDLAAVTYNGQIFGIPGHRGSVLFYYNKTLFAKAGISQFPKTWDEFSAAVKALKAAGITPVSLFTADDAWHATNYLSYFAGELGGPGVFDKPLDSDAVVRAAAYLQQLFQFTTPDAIGGKWAVSIQNFITGKTAILLDGPWAIGLINKQMPNPDQVAAAPAPRFDASGPWLLVTDALTTWAAGRRMSDAQTRAVVDFVKYMTSVEVAKRFAIEAQLPFVAKMQLTPDEQAKAGPLFAANIEYANKADARMVQITRGLKPGAMNALPGLVEKLALKQITADAFATQLQQANLQ